MLNLSKHLLFATLRGMPLSWNEIRHRAIAFNKEWKGETREAGERQSFWNDFFSVFGVRCRTVAGLGGV